MATLNDLRIAYCQAERCWRSNNLRACLQICGQLSRSLSAHASRGIIPSGELDQLKNLVWQLDIKCLSEDYYLNESLLLNEDDNESDDQVKTRTAANSTRGQSFAPSTRAHAPGGSGTRVGTGRRRTMADGSKVDTRAGRPLGTGMLTGRMPSRTSSRQSGRANSSYRPLTTSLTASQTAFSRSTRPLLKYSRSRYLSKLTYDYLYNAQKATSQCPDYRQCLEYLNHVQDGYRDTRDTTTETQRGTEVVESRAAHEQIKLGVFWYISFGICYFSLRMHKQAESYFQLALSADPRCLQPYLWLIKVYMRLNQPLKVLRTCQDGLANSRNAILFNWKARVHLLLNEYSVAHANLRESLLFNPINIEALANIGHFSFYGDQHELSLKCFERIHQLCTNFGSLSLDVGKSSGAGAAHSSTAELCNNLALSNFYCGNYTKVLPLFQSALLNSPSREVTSDIWYNVSFVPLSFGARQLAMACLRLALKNDSQNEDAINNLGCLKYDALINDPLHYGNRQEYWSGSTTAVAELENKDDQRKHESLFDEAEAHFSAPRESDDNQAYAALASGRPESLFNMAVLKRRRGQLVNSMRYCELYNEIDDNNCIIRRIMEEIHELVSHDR